MSGLKAVIASLRRASRKRTVRWGLMFILVGILMASLWLAGEAKYVQTHRAELLVSPKPAPTWILALAPAPGETLSVRQARFGEGQSNDPFWPGYGVICVQIDGRALQITSLNELHSDVVLSLNGSGITELNPEWLIQGLHVFRGYVLASYAEDVFDGLNMCWRMNLEPGDYLAALQVERESGSPLEYEWAFRLTEE